MVGASVLSVVLQRLDKYTVYNVSVTASTAAGPGPAVSMTVRTLSDGEELLDLFQCLLKLYCGCLLYRKHCKLSLAHNTIHKPS